MVRSGSARFIFLYADDGRQSDKTQNNKTVKWGEGVGVGGGGGGSGGGSGNENWYLTFRIFCRLVLKKIILENIFSVLDGLKQGEGRKQN